MNLRPPGYEPDKLPTALLRDIYAHDRTRTGMAVNPRILSPLRLPISSHEHQCNNSYSIVAAIPSSLKKSGDKRDRTADLLNAIQALSHLSYTPELHHKL